MTLTLRAVAQTPKPAVGAGTNVQPGQVVADPKPAVKPDKAQAYFHYALAHYYEDQATMTGRSDLVSKAVDEYRLAAQQRHFFYLALCDSDERFRGDGRNRAGECSLDLG